MIRVLVVYEHQIIGGTIATALAEQLTIEVVGCVTSIDAALDYLVLQPCDVVLVSTTLADNAATQLAYALFHKHCPSKVLVTDVPDSKAAIVHYLEAGAAGYVHEQESLAHLLHKLHALHRNEFPLSPAVAASLMARITELSQMVCLRGSDQTPGLHSLHKMSAREQEVLKLLALGHSNQAIADLLTIEVGTVKNHVYSIFRKLDIHSRTEALLFAQQFD